MPVHFKGKSEYDAKFKWLDSFKSKNFEPSPEQMADMAGLPSAELGTSTEYKQHYLPVQSRKSASFEPTPEQAVDPAGKISTKLGITMEPPIQRKKRCAGPPTSLSGDFNQFPESPASDYALLGPNDKFKENVRYKSKGRPTQNREVSPPKQQKLLKDKENLKYASKTTPAPFVDTSKFRQRSESEKTPLAPRKEKNESADVTKEIKEKEKLPLPIKSTIKGDKIPNKTVEANRMESAVKADVKDKKIDNMNEFVQTNMEKGVADSAPEAPAEYALKYKAGVAPPRARRHKFSEYQKSFTWKDGGKSSPMLAAEQVIYNSNLAMIPPQKTFFKNSEYSAQFKQPHSELDKRAVPRAEKQRSKVRRSKSTGALRSEKIQAAGSSPVISPDNKRQTIESELQGQPKEVVVPPVQHGKLKRPRSEYASNFRSPTKIEYRQGAWRGADPPQLQPKRSDDSDNGGPALSNWFAEVIELRRKAAEYRKRAQGTHFSREHLVQLMAQQNAAWDNLSSARSGTSTLSALSLESGASARLRERQSVVTKETVKGGNAGGKIENTQQALDSTKHEHKISKKDSCDKKAATEKTESVSKPSTKSMQNSKKSNEDDVSLVAHEGSDEELGKPDLEAPKHEDVTKKQELRKKQRKSRKKAWEEDNESDITPQDISSNNGRIPTPKLKEKNTNAKRHHFDRTTPVVGGAILSSPPRPEKRPTMKVSKSWCTPQDVYEDEVSTVVSSENFSALAGQTMAKTYNVQKGPIAATPTFGSPSKDTHMLRDDDASVDQPLQTNFVHSPAKLGKPRAEKPSRSKKRPVGIQPTIPEGFGETYKKPMSWGIDGGEAIPRIDVEDDVLSVSARSVASSCSLASEVYERAQKRTQEFWGKNGIASR